MLKIGEKILLEPANETENQGSVGKCVAMAETELIERMIFVRTGKRINLSYDGLYAIRETWQNQGEDLSPNDGFMNIGKYGMMLESEFKVDDVAYPEIVTHLNQVSPSIRAKAMQYAFQFQPEHIKGLDSLERVLEVMEQGYMVLVVLQVNGMGHAVALRGIKRLGEDLYEYTMRNSWGGTGVLKEQGDHYWLYRRTIYNPILLNPEILEVEEVKEPIVKMQLENPIYTVNGEEKRFEGMDHDKKVDTPPFAVNQRTYIPLRGVLEALGYEVEWIQKTKEIYIYEKQKGDTMIIRDSYIDVPLDYEYFRWSEMACNGDDSVIWSEKVRTFTIMLNKFRNWYKRPIMPVSWYRTVDYNATVPNASNHSQHLNGLAVDFHYPKDEWHGFDDFRKTIFVDNVINKWRELAKEHKVSYGIILYDWGFHIDAGGRNINVLADFRINENYVYKGVQ